MAEPHDIWSDHRSDMVQQQLRARGIHDERVLDAMGNVPREVFVPEAYRNHAYADKPLPIGDNQTISQPYIVALMLQLLKTAPNHRILEIGTGSGYQTALLAELANEVVSIERIAGLSQESGRLLSELGYTNIHLHVGDGTLGHLDGAPYDGVIVTAGGPRIPDALTQQLSDGGRLICPVGDRNKQELLVVSRQGDQFENETYGGCRFVPLIGEDGWTQ